jgi:ribulose-phosphate 3-epimerase
MAVSPVFSALRDAAPTISVGMLTADLLNLGREITLLERAGVRLVHFDVMDGCFCPMSTIGPPVVKAVRTPLLKDVHLMITEPVHKVADYVAAGADLVTVHVEADRHIHRVLQELAARPNLNDPARGVLRGVALNPGTPVEAIEPLLEYADLVLLLAINPGWGGQKFDAATPRRLQRARRLIEESGCDVLLGVDGGITRDNVGDVAALRPDIIVTGSAVFDGKAPEHNARFMLESIAAAVAGAS